MMKKAEMREILTREILFCQEKIDALEPQRDKIRIERNKVDKEYKRVRSQARREDLLCEGFNLGMEFMKVDLEIYGWQKLQKKFAKYFNQRWHTDEFDKYLYAELDKFFS